MVITPRTALIALAAALLAGVLGFLGGRSIAPPSTGALAGPARVVDGDGLEIGAVEIRLVGIDAPERDQACEGSSGQTYQCGKVASDALAKLTEGKSVTCEGKRKDSRGRRLAVCRLDDGTDLNAELVRSGMAVAFRRYSKEYVTQEDEARGQRRAMWAGKFELPSCHRAAKQGRECKDQMPGA